MAQDFDKEDSGNEYQFQEEHDAPEYKYEEHHAVDTDQPVTDVRAKPKKRPLVMIIGGLVVIFVIYQVVHFVFGEKEVAKQSQPAIPPLKTTNKPATEQPVGFNSSSDANVNMGTNTAQDQSSPFANAEPDNNAISAQLTQLQTSIQGLTNGLGQQQFQSQATQMSLQESMTNVTNELQQMTGSLQDLVNAEQRRQAAADHAAWVKKQQEIALRRKKSYFVDAVIPGRAWLKGADGSTITVTVGETIPGYGKVTSINAYSGVVRTASGSIPYGTSS